MYHTNAMSNEGEGSYNMQHGGTLNVPSCEGEPDHAYAPSAPPQYPVPSAPPQYATPPTQPQYLSAPPLARRTTDRYAAPPQMMLTPVVQPVMYAPQRQAMVIQAADKQLRTKVLASRLLCPLWILDLL